MKAVLRFLLAAALLALCAAQRPVQYKANLATVAGYMRPYPRASTPRGTAIATIYNATYATVAFDVRSVIGATMMHIHNGTVPGEFGAGMHRRRRCALQLQHALRTGDGLAQQHH